MADENSKRSRVKPVFEWFDAKADKDWPARLVKLAHGLGVELDPGPLEHMEYMEEIKVPASESRLAWLRQHGAELGHPPSRPEVLEGQTHADCLITCERAVIWIEGKRNDWLSQRTKWDANRDQLARNVEAAWIYASDNEKDEFCVLVCHEFDLRPEEQALVDGYRSQELMAGWPHLDEERRGIFAKRIGTLTWSEILAEWPEMREDVRLASVPLAQ